MLLQGLTKACSVIQAGSIVQVIIATVVVILSWKICQLLWVKRQTKLALKDFACPPTHWFYGHIRTLVGNEKGLTSQGEAATEYGNYQIWFGPFRCVLSLCEPDSIKALANTTEPKYEFAYNFVRPWIGDGLLLSKGTKWFRNRRLLTPAFHFDILNAYVDIFRKCTGEMLEKWKTCEGDTSIEIFQDVSLMTLDSLLCCAFSFKSNCQTKGNDPYIKAVNEMLYLVSKRLRFLPYIADFIFYNSRDGKNFKKACDLVHERAMHVIKERKRSIQEDGLSTDQQGQRKNLDFLDILLRARDEDGNGLTDAEIRDEVDTFMFEGHDTTASGISWCLYNLAKHPEYQQKCRQEIDDLIATKETEKLDWDDLGKMPYTTMCIKESLRTHPPVPYIARSLTKQLVLPDGRKIAQGQNVAIHVFACHHNGTVWPNPEVYDPERFSPENSKDRPSHAFIPFAAGPRNCIGKQFAMNELKVSVAMTVHQYVLTTDQQHQPERDARSVLKAKDGIRLFIKPRQR